MSEMKVLNMKLQPELFDAIKAAAEKKNIPMAALVRMILTEYLEQTNERKK